MKEEGKQKIEEKLSEITFSDAKKISKYYIEEPKKQRKASKKGKSRKIFLGPKMGNFKNLISNLEEFEIKDDSLEGMKNLLLFFEGFLKEISKLEYTPTTYPIRIKLEFITRPTPWMVEILSNRSFLNINHVSNITDTIRV